MELETRRPIIFGEVLFDHFSDGARTLGGAPFNVAWNLQAFGANPLFVSRVGDDEDGVQIQDAMSRHGMDTSGLQRDDKYPTGSVQVSLVCGEPSYEIINDCAYDHISVSELPKVDKESIGLVYHGSLALRNAPSKKALAALLEATEASVFVDVNLRKPWYDSAYILQLLENSRWCKINEEELFELASNDEGLGCDAVAQHLAGRLFNTLFVTRGKMGAIAVTKEGDRADIQPESEVTVVDTIGAGDAFCSILILGLLREWDVPTILSRAQDFASAVVGIRGAVSTDEHFYQQFEQAWNA